jgi:hypothetical protein
LEQTWRSDGALRLPVSASLPGTGRTENPRLTASLSSASRPRLCPSRPGTPSGTGCSPPRTRAIARCEGQPRPSARYREPRPTPRQKGHPWGEPRRERPSRLRSPASRSAARTLPAPPGEQAAAASAIVDEALRAGSRRPARSRSSEEYRPDRPSAGAGRCSSRVLAFAWWSSSNSNESCVSGSTRSVRLPVRSSSTS